MVGESSSLTLESATIPLTFVNNHSLKGGGLSLDHDYFENLVVEHTFL